MVKKCCDGKENLHYNLKFEFNGITRLFIIKCKQICNTRKTEQHKTLHNLSNKENSKFIKYDKANGVCILPKENDLNKLNEIVNDTSKLKEIIKYKRKNWRKPLIKRTEFIKGIIKKNLKQYLD